MNTRKSRLPLNVPLTNRPTWILVEEKSVSVHFLLDPYESVCLGHFDLLIQARLKYPDAQIFDGHSWCLAEVAS